MTKTVRIGSGLVDFDTVRRHLLYEVHDPWMGLSGPAYNCGFHGLRDTGELLWPPPIPRSEVEPGVRIDILDT